MSSRVLWRTLPSVSSTVSSIMMSSSVLSSILSNLVRLRRHCKRAWTRPFGDQNVCNSQMEKVLKQNSETGAETIMLVGKSRTRWTSGRSNSRKIKAGSKVIAVWNFQKLGKPELYFCRGQRSKQGWILQAFTHTTVLLFTSMTSLFGWQISTFLTNFITVCYFVLCWIWRRRRRKRRRWTKLPIIAPYIYDASYHANPYILGTTVLSDKVMVLLVLPIRAKLI